MDFGRVQKQGNDPSKPDKFDKLALEGLNILIVDDDEQNQRMLELILKYVGHVVKFASNGIDAVEKVKSNAFDLVLMDVQMPLMDGLEATRRIREWEDGNKHLAIVGLTAVIDSEFKRCLQAGMDDVISKPFDTARFHEIISTRTNCKRIGSGENNQSAGSAILDVETAVKRFAGDRENYIALLDEFIVSLPEKFKKLTYACEICDWKNLSGQAHNLKGLSANFGAMELSGKIFELEQRLIGGQYDQVEHDLNEIIVSFQSLQAEALAFIGKS